MEKKTVGIIGAGFSGVCATIKLRKKLPSLAITIFDNNSDFGGTWLVNTYPGCACDLPSHLYSFSFEPSSEWSSQYPLQPEILDYIKRLANKYELSELTKFRHQVERVSWQEETLRWELVVMDLEERRTDTLHFDFIFCGTGEYHLPKIPEIFAPFEGAMMHSAEWKDDIQLEGKTVAVIGSGASAVQIIPNIVDRVGKLLSFQRTPSWVISRFQFEMPRVMKWAFRRIPGVRRLYRASLYIASEIQYPAFQIRGFLSHFARPIARVLGKVQLCRQVRSVSLREQLRPNYTFGCNRVCLSNEYYPALAKDNVELIRDDIIGVTQDSIVTKDRRDKIDVLILATGFHIHEYFGPLEIVGRKGEAILRKWKVDGPSIYLGIVSHSMPNLFFIHGPGVDLGHNSGIFTMECQVDWVLQLISEMGRKGASAVAVRKEVEDEYKRKLHRDMSNTVWSKDDCSSYYVNDHGLITIVYPRSQIDYWWRTRGVKTEEFEFLT